MLLTLCLVVVGCDDEQNNVQKDQTSQRVKDKIAIASDRDENVKIYVMDADGTDQTRLTTNDADEEYAAFRPQG